MKIAFVDIDGTLIRGQTQLHFLFFLFWEKEISFIDVARVISWYFGYRVLGKSINENLAGKIYKKIVGGKSVGDINNITAHYFSRVEKYMFPGAPSLLQELRKENYSIFFLTSTLRPIADKFNEFFGADGAYCTELEIKDGYYTGEIKGKIMQGSRKAKKLSDIIEEKDPEVVAVFSDHISDLPVFRFATRPVAVNPDHKLNKFAKKERWEIIKL